LMGFCTAIGPHRHCKGHLDKPWNHQRTSLLSGQAIQNSWDKPSLGASIFHTAWNGMYFHDYFRNGRRKDWATGIDLTQPGGSGEGIVNVFDAQDRFRWILGGCRPLATCCRPPLPLCKHGEGDASLGLRTNLRRPNFLGCLSAQSCKSAR